MAKKKHHDKETQEHKDIHSHVKALHDILEDDACPVKFATEWDELRESIGASDASCCHDCVVEMKLPKKEEDSLFDVLDTIKGATWVIKQKDKAGIQKVKEQLAEFLKG